MKTIVATAVALVIGVAVGAFGLTAYYQNQGEQAGERDDAAMKIAALEAELSEKEERLERLQWENDNYREELSREPIDFFSDRNSGQEAPAFGPEMMGDFDMEEMAALAEDADSGDNDDEELTEEERQAAEERRQAREARRAEWEERRVEWAERAQDNVYRMLDEELMKTDDPAAQERIYALGEYTDFFFDIGERMSQAENDEERRAIREEAGRAMREAGQLMEEQRQHMLREMASQYADDPAQQQAIVENFQQTLESPFFQARGGMLPMGGPMMGGGPGGGRGGFGGGRGRGGGGGN